MQLVKPLPERALLDDVYHQVGDIAEHVCHLELAVADLDDDQLSIDLNELQQAVLQIDRHLRTRRCSNWQELPPGDLRDG